MQNRLLVTVPTLNRTRVELNPGQSAGEVAKQIKLKAPTVQYQLAKLREEGVVTERCFINPYALGLMDFGFYFSLGLASSVLRDEILTIIRRNDHVAWFGPLLGDFQYQIAYYARSPRDLYAFIESLGDRNEGPFSHKLLAIRTAFYRYSRGYLTGASKNKLFLAMSIDAPPASHDEIDERILSSLGAHTGVVSLRELSRTVQIPFSTVERRVRRLRSDKIICGNYLDISPSVLGIETYRVALSLKNLSATLKSNLRKFCRNHPHITFHLESLGSWDFEIGLEVFSAKHVKPIIDEIHAVCGLNLTEYKVHLEVEEQKIDYFPVGRVRK